MSHGSFGYAGVRVKIKRGWENAGRLGTMECFVTPDYRGAPSGSQYWIVLIWDGEDEPDLFKASGLLFKGPGEKYFQERVIS